MRFLKSVLIAVLPALIIGFIFLIYKGFNFEMSEYQSQILGLSMLGAISLGIAQAINTAVDSDGHETLGSFIPFVILSVVSIIIGIIIFAIPTIEGYGIAVSFRYLYLPAVSLVFLYNYLVAGYGLANSYYRAYGPSIYLAIPFIIGFFSLSEGFYLTLFIAIPIICLIALIIFIIIYRRLPNGTWRDDVGESVGDRIHSYKSNSSSSSYSSKSSYSSGSGKSGQIESRLRGISGHTYNNYVEAYLDSANAYDSGNGSYSIDIYVSLTITSYADSASQSEINTDAKRALDDLMNEVRSTLDGMGIRYRVRTHTS